MPKQSKKKSDKKPTLRHLPAGGKKKHDWQALKQEFMLAEEMEVKRFFINKYGYHNGTVIKSTAGWTKEKEAWRAKLTQKILDQTQDEELQEAMQVLRQIKSGFKMKVATKGDIDKLNPAGLKTIWEVWRTEAGLPTRITKQQFDPDAPLAFMDYSEEAAKRLKKYSPKDNDPKKEQ